jgi:hypothetical protein
MSLTADALSNLGLKCKAADQAAFKKKKKANYCKVSVDVANVILLQSLSAV